MLFVVVKVDIIEFGSWGVGFVIVVGVFFMMIGWGGFNCISVWGVILVVFFFVVVFFFCVVGLEICCGVYVFEIFLLRDEFVLFVLGWFFEVE